MLYEHQESIIEKDVVQIYIEEEPSFFARIEKIVADMKKGWWQVTFLMLKNPLSDFIWILDNQQIRGAEFTMNNVPIRIEKVRSLKQEDPEPPDNNISNKKATILSLKTKP